MGLLNRISFTTNDREVQNMREELDNIITESVQKGFDNLNVKYKLDIKLINQRLDEMSKRERVKRITSLITSSILIGVVLFKSSDPLYAIWEIIKILLTGVS